MDSFLNIDCSTGTDSKYTLVQYQFIHDEHELDAPLPHGNSKTGRSYRQVFQSTRQALRSCDRAKNANPKELLDDVYCSVGDVTTARSHGQLPRGPRDIYNARFAANKHNHEEQTSTNMCEMNTIWQLLEKAKRDEKECDESAFIRECRIHPDFLVVLVSH